MRAKGKKSDIDKLKEGGLRLWHVIAITVLFVVMICSVIYCYNNRKGIGTEVMYDAYDNDLIFNGLFVESVNVGGLTKKQAEDKINRVYVQPKTSAIVTFRHDDYSKDYTMGELGLEFNISKAVNEAYKAGRKGSKVERIAYADEVASRKEFITIEYDVSQSKINSAVNDVSKELGRLGVKVDKDMLKNTLKDVTVQNWEDTIVEVPVK